jgi:phosphoribosylamine--glycine ligase
VSGGYPEDYEKNKVVTGLNKVTNSQVFHSGTTFKNEDVVTNGGRVFAITSFGKTIEDAIAKSFIAAETVNYDGKYYRSDIGKDLMNWGK